MPRFLQMARLRVEFERIETSAVQTLFWVDEEDYELWFSAVVYRDAFAQLCEVLLKLLDEDGSLTVLWMERPPNEYEMRFGKQGDLIELEMRHFEDWNRANDANAGSYLWFEISGNYTEICVPFWRALKELRGLYPRDEEFEARWHHPFPDAEFVALTDELRARRLT